MTNTEIAAQISEKFKWDYFKGQHQITLSRVIVDALDVKDVEIKRLTTLLNGAANALSATQKGLEFVAECGTCKTCANHAKTALVKARGEL